MAACKALLLNVIEQCWLAVGLKREWEEEEEWEEEREGIPE